MKSVWMNSLLEILDCYQLSNASFKTHKWISEKDSGLSITKKESRSQWPGVVKVKLSPA